MYLYLIDRNIPIHEDELQRADNPLNKEQRGPSGPVEGTTLDDSTSW